MANVDPKMRRQFFRVVQQGDVEGVHQALRGIKKSRSIRHGTGRLLNELADEDKQTALHVAVDSNFIKLTAWLLRKSADVNVVDKTNCTPLLLASSRGHMEICKLLLQQKKIDVNIANIDNTTPLHYLGRHICSSNKSLTVLAELVKEMIKKKANLNAENNQGETPFHQAVRIGNEEIITLLYNGGANIDCQNKNGETPLHYSILTGRQAMVEQLLNIGATKSLKSKNDETPVDMAIRLDKQEIASLIQNFEPVDAKRRQQLKQREKHLKKYEKMVSTLTRIQFFANTLSVLVDKADYDYLAKALIHISIQQGATVGLIRGLIAVEFQNGSSDSASVLRGNCPASKVMGKFSRRIGQEYLQKTLQSVVLEIVSNEALDFELDPTKLRNVDESDVEETLKANRDTLLKHADSLLRKITSDQKMEIMPREIRAIAGFIAEYARKYCSDREAALVGGFIMLRLINPSLVAPESYGMLPWGKSPSQKARRNLVLLTKLLQNLSNGVEFGVKEPHMKVVNSFLTDNRDVMLKWLKTVTTDPVAGQNDTEWEDCKHLNTDKAVDVTMLDLKVLEFLHRLIHQHLDKIKAALASSNSEMSAKERNTALGLVKSLEQMGPPK